jgi:outer membrane protein OmpA-like peptidoglycan-associated protein
MVVSVLLAVAASPGCAGEGSARKPCPSDAWLGTCKLASLKQVEEREMPMPYVVYEAIYAPEANAQYPHFTPAELRMRFGTAARSGFALLDHLRAQVSVACRAKAAPGSCLPGELLADVVPFDPEHVGVAGAPRISGCAAIDAASEQDRLASSHAEAEQIAERFVFAAGSSALSPDATSTASAVAKRMASEPSLECLGVVGQISPGESPSLAEARARAVKQLLISLGVEAKRLQTIAATASVFGPGSKAPAEEPDSRRVSLSVLLKTAEKSGH